MKILPWHSQLSGEGWKHFLTLNSLYEKGELKSQKSKASDIVKKGRPLLRQWHLKPLCKLPPKDQTLLSEKVCITVHLVIYVHFSFSHFSH